MDMSSADMVYGKDIPRADWTHVENCSFDSCKATLKLQDWSSLSR